MESLFNRSGQGVVVQHAPQRTMQAPDRNASEVWNLILNMHKAREYVVKEWYRKNKLWKAIQDHPGHESNAIASSRIDQIDEKIVNDQLVFLDSEWRVRSRWEDTRPVDRIREGMHDLLNIDPESETVGPLWHVPFGVSMKGAPLECSIQPLVLQFVSPTIARIYDRAIRSQ